MAVPKYYEFFAPIMNLLSDGNAHTRKEIREYCASEFQLSEDDKKIRIQSG